MTTNIPDPSTLIVAPARHTDGERIGEIGGIYYDNETNQPAGPR